MATPAQINANRANAQLSTGPRSAEGKAAASRNSLKSGLTAQARVIPGEDPDALARLTGEFEAEFQPQGPVETCLVQTLVRAVWMQQRCDRIEAAYLNARVAALPEDTLHPLGVAIMQDAANGDTLHKIFRRRQGFEREWTRSLESLSRIQGRRFVEDAEVEAEAPVERTQPASAPPAAPNRVRFVVDPQPAVPRAAEPPVNFALRL